MAIYYPMCDYEKIELTKTSFKRKMKEIKRILLNNSWSLFTCPLMRDQFTLNYEIFIKYEQFLKKYHLKDTYHNTLDNYKNSELTKEEALFRRYIILDAFEQEMLATYKFSK